MRHVYLTLHKYRMKKNISGKLFFSFLTALLWVASMKWVSSKIGLVGIAYGLPISALVSLPIAGAFLWLDRWVQGPPGLLLSAFAWGASAAGFFSIWSQEGLQVLANTYGGVEFGQWFRPLVITPMTEELFKGMFLVWMLMYRRNQIRGLVDGIVYAGLIGAGFAFSEQTMYFGQMMSKYQASSQSDTTAITTLAMSFVLRGFMVPFMHSFFVAFVGLGVAVATGFRRPATQAMFVVIGFIIPIALHGVWDWAGLASEEPFLIVKIYAAVMVPLFLGLTAFALILRRRQGRLIANALPGLAQAGHIENNEILILGSLKERRRWRKTACRNAGRAAAGLVGRYQAEASALAILTAQSSKTERLDEIRHQVELLNTARTKMEAAL